MGGVNQLQVTTTSNIWGTDNDYDLHMGKGLPWKGQLDPVGKHWKNGIRVSSRAAKRWF